MYIIIKQNLQKRKKKSSFIYFVQFTCESM